MQDNEIYGKLAEVFEDIFDEPVDIKPELTAGEVEGWDSVQHIRLVLSVEQAFGIRFSAAEVGEMKNVGEMVSAIKRKL